MFLRLYLENGNNIQICESRVSIRERTDEDVIYPWYGVTDREMELTFDENGDFDEIKYVRYGNTLKYPYHEGKIVDWKIEKANQEDREVFYEFLTNKVRDRKKLRELERKIFE